MRASLIGLASALFLASAVSSALANPEPEVDDKVFRGGNAMERLTAAAAALPNEYWPLKYMLSTLEGRILLYRYWLFRMMYGQPGAPAARGGAAPLPQPDLDGPPAESILDQMDESDAPPVLVGEPGTRLQSLDAMGEIPTPPADSNLDQIEDSPKPAVNQASPPQIVEVKGK